MIAVPVAASSHPLAEEAGAIAGEIDPAAPAPPRPPPCRTRFERSCPISLLEHVVAVARRVTRGGDDGRAGELRFRLARIGRLQHQLKAPPRPALKSAGPAQRRRLPAGTAPASGCRRLVALADMGDQPERQAELGAEECRRRRRWRCSAAAPARGQTAPASASRSCCARTTVVTPSVAGEAAIGPSGGSGPVLSIGSHDICGSAKVATCGSGSARLRPTKPGSGGTEDARRQRR